MSTVIVTVSISWEVNLHSLDVQSPVEIHFDSVRRYKDFSSEIMRRLRRQTLSCKTKVSLTLSFTLCIGITSFIDSSFENLFVTDSEARSFICKISVIPKTHKSYSTYYMNLTVSFFNVCHSRPLFIYFRIFSTYSW